MDCLNFKKKNKKKMKKKKKNKKKKKKKTLRYFDLWNVGNYDSIDTVLHPRKPDS